MQSGQKYEYDFTVRYGYCDFAGRMLPSDLLKEAQQAATEHLDAAGLGVDFLNERKLAFVLSRQRLSVVRFPRGGERVRVVTEPACCGPIYPRHTSFFDQKGEKLAELLALWTLIDLGQRRILRRGPKELTDFFPVQSKPPKLERLPEMERITASRPFAVPYSMTDVNGHLNNASYADLVADCLQEELMSGRVISCMDICYHSELLAGAKAQLLRACVPGGVLVMGVSGDTRHFECLTSFSEEE